MEAYTRKLWTKQERHPGDRLNLFAAVADAVGGRTVLYPGSFVDVAASSVFQSVTYVDSNRATPRFFADVDGVHEIISSQPGAPDDPEVRFIHSDYGDDLGLPPGSFDLLISLYAGFVSEACTDYLRIGGALLVNSSHGDAAMASIDSRYRLSGVVLSRAGSYRVATADLDMYLIPKSSVEVTPEMLHRAGRGIQYTKTPYAYLFERIA